jgi:hypothetical protein
MAIKVVVLKEGVKKTCSSCKMEKDRETDFYLRTTGNRHRQCKACLIKRATTNNAEHKVRHRGYMRKYMAAIRSGERQSETCALINAAKAKPCTDCKQTFPPECMDLDHLPGHVKVAAVSNMIWCTVERVKAELAKCEVVCANCHRIRSKNRKLAAKPQL